MTLGAGPPRWQPLFDKLSRVKQGWPTRGWSWDGRLECIASSFSAMHEQKARAALAEAFPLVWNHTNLGRAPARIQTFAESTGGVRSGQAIMATDAPGGYTAYGLWWPWGDGVSISMRMGILDLNPAREPYPSFFQLFNVEL